MKIETKVKGGIAEPQARADDADLKEDLRPTYDQLYLASRIEGDSPLTPAAIQRLNIQYGVQRVCDAMRTMHGFGRAIRRPVPYLVALLQLTEPGEQGL